MIANSTDFLLMDMGPGLFTGLVIVQFPPGGYTYYSLHWGHPSEDLAIKGGFPL